MKNEIIIEEVNTTNEKELEIMVTTKVLEYANRALVDGHYIADGHLEDTPVKKRFLLKESREIIGEIEEAIGEPMPRNVKHDLRVLTEEFVDCLGRMESRMSKDGKNVLKEMREVDINRIIENMRNVG